MELVCVRHGRTAWNAVRRFQGQTDIPLDEAGFAQAQALAAHLRAERFDLALTSDLSRARATAEAICRDRDLVPEPTVALREMHFGVWEGLTWEQIVERWPELERRSETSPRHYTPEGGESWAALCARVAALLRTVTARLGPDGRALIVSHAGVMHGIVHEVTRTAPPGEPADGIGVRFVPAAILRVSGSFERGWKLVAVNETADSGDAARSSSA